MDKKPNTYKLNITGNGITIDREITEDALAKITAIALGVALVPEVCPDKSILQISDSGMETKKSTGEPLSPKLFMAQKKPSSEVERITVLAYYLTHYRNTAKFKTLSLTKLNTEAAQPNFSNPAVFVRNADRSEYLSKAGSGSKQITVLGEAIVEALPDRDKVKQVIAESKSNRSRRIRKNSKKKNK